MTKAEKATQAQNQELILDVVEKRVMAILRLANKPLVSQRGRQTLSKLKEEIVNIMALPAEDDS